MEYIDIEGLTLTGDGEKYATALALRGQYITRDEALRTLYITQGIVAKTSGYDEVFTSPTGRHFFSIFPPTLLVHVVPDGYDYKYRTDNIDEWSYYAAGCTERECRELLARDTAPTPAHRLYGKFLQAKVWQKNLRSVRSTVLDSPLRQHSDITVITELENQLKYLTSIDYDVVIDLEWTIDKRELISIQCTALDALSTIRATYLATYAHTRGRPNANDNWNRGLTHLLKRLNSLGKKVVLHNAKADINQFYEGDPLDLFSLNIHDTILMAYVAGEQELGLKELTKNVLKRPVMALPKDLHLQPLDVQVKYGIADVENTRDLYWVLKRKLEETNQWDVYDNIERPLVPIIASMEKFGSLLDVKQLKHLHEQFSYVEEALRSHVWAKTRLDISDDKQQRAYIQKNLGYDIGSLDKRVLSSISGDWMDTLLGYRNMRTLRRNFLGKHIAQAHSSLGEYYAYPTFNQAGRDTETGSWRNAPATGRFSSANPNFQNQPRELRDCFVPPSGHELVSLDYSALELRVAAAVSQDPVMLAILNAGDDIHAFMQSRILEETGIKVTRTGAKNANFNLRYGGSGDMLVTIAAKERAFLPYEVAEKIVEVDRNTYQGYWKWYEGVVDSARKNGYSESLWGRRRYNADLNSRDNTRRAHAERAAANMVVQGTAADIIKIAMRRLVPVIQTYAAHLAIQVHDELVFWVPDANVSKFLQAAKAIMESVELPGIKLKVEGNAGRNWAEAK